jgi:DNA-binding SARP family transcriptional activator
VQREPEIRLCLLSGFEVTAGGRRITVAGSSQRLVAYTALNARPLPRSHVAGVLWSEARGDRANGNLRSAIFRLRVLGIELLKVANDMISVSEDVIVDVRTMTDKARRLLDPASIFEGAESPIDLLDTDLLPMWEDEWVVVERERLRQLRLHALEQLCERLVTVARFGDAVAAGLAAVNAEPLRESAHRALIRAHLAEGNRLEAVRQYRRYCRILDEELGLGPTQQMTELMHEVLPITLR